MLWLTRHRSLAERRSWAADLTHSKILAWHPLWQHAVASDVTVGNTTSCERADCDRTQPQLKSIGLDEGRQPTGAIHSSGWPSQLSQWHSHDDNMINIVLSISIILYPVRVPGLRIDPLRLLAKCRKRWLNQVPLNLRGLIWLLMMDWSERGNIHKRAPHGSPSARTQLFAADRWTSHGSKKEETRWRPMEVPEETKRSTI